MYSATEITHTVTELTVARGFSKDDSERFTSIARTVANDLNRTRDARCVRLVAERDTFPSFLLALAVQALFVLWIPCLLAIAMAKARSTIDQAEFTTMGVRKTKDTRDSAILGEQRALFMPRLCFGILLLLGTNYVFAPFGLKTSYLMSIVDQHAAAGQTSFTLWTTSFGSSPVIVAGFLGFLLYALLTATQRYAQDDFDDQAMFSLLIRGLIVILLSFALSASPLPDVASRSFVFFAGVFPVRALEALGARLNMTLDPDFSADRMVSAFEGLPSLEPTKAFALRTAGIRSTYDLAAMDINTVATRVRIDPRLLGRTVDRAILIDAVGLVLVGKLGEIGIQVATEVATFDGNVPANVAAQLGGKETADQISKRLAQDPRVIAVREWLVSFSTAPVPSELAEKVTFGKRLMEMILDADTQNAMAKAKGDFVTIDLSAFGGNKGAPFLIREFINFGALTDAIYGEIPKGNRPPRYQYGKSWVLTKGGVTIDHTRMALKTWGMPVSDLTSLADRNIKGGDTLVAVRLEDAMPLAVPDAPKTATPTDVPAPEVAPIPWTPTK